MAATQFEIIRKTSSDRNKVDFKNLPFGRIMSDHMFTAEYKNGSWGNFKIEPYGPMEVLPAMISLHYAQAIFEGLKAYQNKNSEIVLFRPDQNAVRFNRSAARMCMPSFPEDVFVDAITQLVSLDRNWVPTTEEGSLYIRPHMFGTDEYIGVQPSETYKFIIFTSPSGPYFSKPTRMKLETKYSRASAGGIGSAKAGANYAASLYPTRLAVSEGYDQVIWTDSSEHRFVEEAGTMNLFFRLGNELVTASLDDRILDGITRKSVMTIAKDLGYNVIERQISVAEVITGARNKHLKEAFGAGTAAVISPIAVIGYNGEDIALSQDPDSRQYSQNIVNKLEAIRSGEAEDTHGWIRKVTESNYQEALFTA